MPDIKEKMVELLSQVQNCGVLQGDHVLHVTHPSNETVANHLIANGVTIQQWISVEERLPKGRRDYLCRCVFGDSKMQFYNVLMFHPEQNAENGYVTGPHFSNEGMSCMRVTHWMPLPQPPKGE